MNSSNILFESFASSTHANYLVSTTTMDNYTNNSLVVGDSNQFILPVWRQLLWSILYTGMVVVATGGNLIVIWIVLAHKRMRTVTNYFLLNLSIADTMVSTLNVTFNFVYMLNSHWPFGKLYCKISQFTSGLSICASVFSLMAISIDRYMAIITPLRPRMGKMVTLSLAISTWLLGILISSPYLFVFTTFTIKFRDGEERVVCYAVWPDGETGNSYLEYIYNVTLLFMTYVVPIVSMTYTYARIGIELWGSQSIGECTQRQMDNIKSKRRVVKMMVVVVIIFAVCWLPFHMYFIISSYYPEINDSSYIQETFLSIYWLAMSNSMYNPIIYCWMNARFRRGFKQFFSCLPYVNTNAGTFTRREVFTSKRRSYPGSEHNRMLRNGTVRTQINAAQEMRRCEGQELVRINPLDETLSTNVLADELNRRRQSAKNKWMFHDADADEHFREEEWKDTQELACRQRRTWI